MCLLIAADIFPPESGGPATYAVALANELVKLGDEVKIVSLNPNSDKSCVMCNLYRVTYKNKLLKYLQYLYLLWEHSGEVDIIYAMGPVNAGLPALVAARLRHKKFVVKVVGDYAWEQWQNQKSKACPERSRRIKNQSSDFVPPENFIKQKVGFKIKLLKWIERLVVHQANKIIVPSEYLKKIVISWGAEVNKIVVVYNAVEFSVVEAKKHEGERWLVSVGRLAPWKGFDILIELFKICHSRENGNPEIRLKIVGDGPEIESLKSKVKSLKLENSVELLGNLSHQETLSYIKSADVLVLNSGYEGLSHVILEAIDAGVPIIASKVGGNPELLSENNLFIYNDQAEIIDKILVVLENKNKFILDKTILEKFKFETMVSRTKLVLAELINHSTNNQ